MWYTYVLYANYIQRLKSRYLVFILPHFILVLMQHNDDAQSSPERS